MTKYFLFFSCLLLTGSALARYEARESRVFKCTKDLELSLFSDERWPRINGKHLLPNRTGLNTIGQDEKGNRYELRSTRDPRVRLLQIFEPMLNRTLDTLTCNEVRG